MLQRLAFCLLLCCLSFPLMARDGRMMGANGDGGAATQDDCDRGAATDRPAKPAPHAAKPAKPKPAAAVRGGGGDAGDVRPPRWHSFLPGMFR